MNLDFFFLRKICILKLLEVKKITRRAGPISRSPVNPWEDKSPPSVPTSPHRSAALARPPAPTPTPTPTPRAESHACVLIQRKGPSAAACLCWRPKMDGEEENVGPFRRTSARTRRMASRMASALASSDNRAQVTTA